MLPAPRGAKENRTLRGARGWLPTDVFLAEIAEKEDRDEFRQRLVDWGLRHIAARGWTTEDGTRTRDLPAAVRHRERCGRPVPPRAVPEHAGPSHRVAGTENVVSDETFPEAATVAGVQRTVYDEAEPRGAEHDRQAYLVSGDVLAVVLQSRKGAAHAVPFRQTVVLQSQLLG
ncbi:Secreted protein OS=Streptomyces albaduncus OX=68172 GN=FHS32_004066 PE=4 SV=1 [Streptomyces griseoloalbus]